MVTYEDLSIGTYGCFRLRRQLYAGYYRTVE
jgi:hypothetical protein